MKVFLIFTIYLILLPNIIISGQTADVILTKEVNNIWLKSLKNLPIDSQIILIKNRILQDTLTFNANQLRSDVIVFENQKVEQLFKDKGYISEGRVLYYVRYKNKLQRTYHFLQFKWDNWTDIALVKRFHDFISIDKIFNVEIISDENKEKALFGSRAGFGVIIFDLSKKEYVKEFKNVFRE